MFARDTEGQGRVKPPLAGTPDLGGRNRERRAAGGDEGLACLPRYPYSRKASLSTFASPSRTPSPDAKAHLPGPTTVPVPPPPSCRARTASACIPRHSRALLRALRTLRAVTTPQLIGTLIARRMSLMGHI
ncbi:hypothetical protein K458DRAFT_391656 [Lentithecium fluviatile CBS 122367]|uniref:Uncharacterized protein n=1 Tax=Lentithecium fluviatile CBS 122367 TaxID=1168545 RepID=A0A6G1IU66_9PLEO|nr:hypothetical protein K458DRAFT_391656 [Lentithecium fluviatile CBS 122367]